MDKWGIIETVAGGPQQSDADRRDPRRPWFKHPSGVTSLGAPRELYVVDSNRCLIHRVGRDGRGCVIAGRRRRGYSGDGGSATLAQLALPTEVLLDSRGGLYIADRENHAIRYIDDAGVISTFAGGNGPGFSGDGGPAVSARLNKPRSLAIESDGTIVFSDRDNHAIRRIAPEGIISTMVGGPPGSWPAGDLEDGGFPLRRPRGVALDSRGTLYIADRNNHAIRRVNSDRTLTTVAGAHGPGYTGDGGPATAARFHHPSAIVFTPDGTAFVAEHSNHAIRRITPNGTITTLSGGLGAGHDGDGGPAERAQLNWPSGLALDNEGNLYVADRRNHAIRVIWGATHLKGC